MMRVAVWALFVPALIVTAGAVIADSSAIVERQTILKGFGEATKPIGPMLRGTAPFDLATVDKALTTLSDGAKQLPALFPDDSKTGNKTEALPKIWEDKATFVGLYGKLGSDATAALAAIKDEATFKANMPKVLGNCKNCHDNYRAKS